MSSQSKTTEDQVIKVFYIVNKLSRIFLIFKKISFVVSYQAD